VALSRAAIVVLAALAPAAAHAQDAAAPDGGAPPDGGAASDAGPRGAPGTVADAHPEDGRPVFEPPRALSDTHLPYPANAPEITEPVVVTVKLLVDVTGAVKKADLLTPPHPPFDEAVLAAARAFRFEPGRYGGAPVPVAVTFTQRFLPRARPAAETAAAPGTPAAAAGPALTAVLRGRIVELGTRAPIAHATVSAIVKDKGGTDQYYAAESGLDGRFRLPLPPGAARVSVFAAEHDTFVQKETLADRQEVAVTYYVAAERYNPYETVVVAERKREEVSRITLRGAEIEQIPGTFGDPFRVIQTLPGVSSVVSLLPFPVVRGSSPAATGFLLDGTRVPLLFHLLSGPSVIHPLFIDEIQFYPGGAPAPYGGYVGGIVDGRTARARRDEKVVDIDVNMLQAGGLVRGPVDFLDATVTAAGRYGYPGLVLSLATNQASLSYWDYQLRLDGGNPVNGWTVFFFGARDELDSPAANSDPNNPTLVPQLILGFHRGDLRIHRTQGRLEETYRLVLGYDQTYSMGTDFSVLNAEPRVDVEWRQSEKLRIGGGLSGTFRDLRQGAGAVASADAFSSLTSSLGTAYSQSAYLEAIWRPTPRLLLRPGVRGDLYQDDTASKGAVDPRFTARYRLLERDLPGVAEGSDDRAVFLKGSAGIYHQPPRFVLPLPGLDLMPLKYGLMRSYQTSLGTEIPLREKTSLSLEGFFNYMDPTIFDLSINQTSVVTNPNQTVAPNTIVMPPNDMQMFIDRLTAPQLGRSYGLEVLLRRRSTTGVFGWISYTLSRSERFHVAVPATATAPGMAAFWAPYDFDRTHIFNLVMGLPLRRNWDLGLRLQYQSGRPVTTTAGYNTATGDGYFRFDFRVDKHAVYRKWLLDFYVDVTNAAVLPEEIEPGTVIRYVLPTVGFRARL
jgi:TonB family protein